LVRFHGGSSNRTKKLLYWQKGKKSKLAFMHDFLAAQRRRQAWQRGGGAKLDSVEAALGLAAWLHSAASSGHGRASRHQRRAATLRRWGSNENTGGNSNGGGTNNQQSTKITETATMTATKITIETKGTVVAAEARWQRRGASSLAVEAAAWWERGIGGVGSTAAA
jgi:hypothetical protein